MGLLDITQLLISIPGACLRLVIIVTLKLFDEGKHAYFHVVPQIYNIQLF